MSPGKEKAPRGCLNNHARGGYNSNSQTKTSTKGRHGQKFNFDRSKLLLPATYYSRYFKLPRLHGRVMVNCCFHDDRTPSLSIDLTDGWFNCFGCGAKGKNIVKFHMTKFDLNYKQAIRELEAFSER